MKRRELVARGAALAGSTSLLGVSRLLAQAPVAEPIAARVPRGTMPTTAAAPQPISEDERVQRRDKAQTLMKQLGFAALLIEPGANMTYFSGIEWGRSERLFALIIPQSGKPVVIAPGFEQQRAEDQVNGRFDIRVWQEDQNPEALVADVIKEGGGPDGARGCLYARTGPVLLY